MYIYIYIYIYFGQPACKAVVRGREQYHRMHLCR